MEKNKIPRGALNYSFIGIQLAVTVTAFVIGGYKLDQHLHKSPLFVIIGSFLGMIIGFYHLIKQLQDIERKEKINENKKRNRWM